MRAGFDSQENGMSTRRKSDRREVVLCSKAMTACPEISPLASFILTRPIPFSQRDIPVPTSAATRESRLAQNNPSRCRCKPLLRHPSWRSAFQQTRSLQFTQLAYTSISVDPFRNHMFALYISFNLSLTLQTFGL